MAVIELCSLGATVNGLACTSMLSAVVATNWICTVVSVPSGLVAVITAGPALDACRSTEASPLASVVAEAAASVPRVVENVMFSPAWAAPPTVQFTVTVTGVFSGTWVPEAGAVITNESSDTVSVTSSVMPSAVADRVSAPAAEAVTCT